MAERDRQERTDRLETTILSIESLQQTGILNVQRAKGGVRETARIVFLHGQPVEAVAGARTSQDALDWVCTWGSCRYTFDVRFPSEIVVPPPSAPAVEEENPSVSPVAFFAQVVQNITHPLSGSGQTTEELPAERPEENVPTAPLPPPQTPFPSGYPFTPFPQPGASRARPVRQSPPFRLLNGSDAVSYMDRYHLSRLHRHVFFLLDGQRTVVDVVRLTGRSFHEIQSLLAELERLGLIRMEHTSMDGAMNGM